MSQEVTERIPLKPVVSVSREATVFEAVKAMVARNVGAAVVLEGEKLVGVVTERDVSRRVVLAGLDPKQTPVAEVMTKQVLTVREDADRTSALQLMAKHHIRHLPVVDAAGRVKTMLSMRHLLRAEVLDLQQTVWELVGDTAIDGPGG